MTGRYRKETREHRSARAGSSQAGPGLARVALRVLTCLRAGAQDRSVQHDWQSRAVPVAQAVRVVRPGHHVFVGSACATPRRLLEALEALAPVGVQLIHFLTDGAIAHRDGAPASWFRHRAFYIGRDMRELATRAPVDYVPIALADVPPLIAAGRLAFDVALVQASPPDERGMCSLGVS